MQPIDAHTTVRELLIAFPLAFEVLAAHGMCADCRNDPPPVPLLHFAQKHCDGNLTGLLAEIDSVIQQQATRLPVDTGRPLRGT
jgi:hypothetical protein